MPLEVSPEKIGFNPRGEGSFKLPFKEQIDFFRQKLNLPTTYYDDIIKSAHDRAFIVAGAAKADLLDDFRQAIDKAITEGKSIGWFCGEFDKIVAKHGWAYNGERDWRSRVIYTTNLRASYAAGRYAQLTDPDLLKVRPYWKYKHSDTVAHPRPLHQSWNNTVLRYDDPWWLTHFCPNGYGCQCYVVAVRPSEYKGHPAPDDGTYTKVDAFGNSHVLPNGVDYGWDYQPGANRSTPLKDIIDQKLIRFPTSIGADMWQALKPALAIETTQQWHNTLAQWLSTPQAGRTAIVGGIEPPILDWLNNKQITPQSAEIAIREGLIRGSKQARHDLAGDGLSEMEWRQLPTIIANPDQVLFDTRSGKLIYIAAAATDGVKLAVEFDYKKVKGGPLNMIVSGFRQSTAILAEMIRGGLYEVVQ